MFLAYIFQTMIRQEQQNYDVDLQELKQYCSSMNLMDSQHEQPQLQLEEEQALLQTYHHWKITQSTKYETFRSHKYESLSPNQLQLSPSNDQHHYQSNSPPKNYIQNSFCTTIKPQIKRTQNKNQKFQLRVMKIQNHLELPQRFTSFRSRLVKSQHRYNYNPEKQLKPYITAKNYIAIFTDSKEPLIGENMHQRKQIASLTKIMTAYTVLCICQQFGIKVREHYIPVNTRASYMEGTSANLRSGEEILIIDLLYGLLLPSGNDASIALAQYFGKFLSFKFVKDSESNEKNCSNIQKFNQNIKFYDMQYERQSIKLFVFEMNKYAYDIGMLNTKFVNPSGLTHNQNYSTATDIALLTSLCLKNHLLRLIFKRKIHKCNAINDKLGYNREVIWKNTNKLIYKIKECIGVKTGITPGAGPCLSSAFKIGSKELVVIVLQSRDSQQRFNDSQKIYKWCRQIINHNNQS